MKKIAGITTTLVIIGIVSFYFWGSSSHYEIEKYTEIINFNSSKESYLKDTLSICTYNIGYLSGMTNNLPISPDEDFYNKNLKNAQQLFESINPDFIGFQEIDYNSNRSYNVNQMTEIANHCNYGYGAAAINWDKKYVPFPYWPPSMHFGEMLSGQGVISKYPIKSNEIKTLAKPESNPFYYNAFYLERLAQITQVEVNGTSLIIINVHLEAFDIETREIHAQTVLEIYRQYEKTHPVLLVGDFNSTSPFATNGYENDKTMEYIFNEPGIGSAIVKEQYLQSEKDYFTFSSGDPTDKIDYIFYNKNKISPVSGKVLKTAGQISDHIPVLFEFSFIK